MFKYVRNDGIFLEFSADFKWTTGVMTLNVALTCSVLLIIMDLVVDTLKRRVNSIVCRMNLQVASVYFIDDGSLSTALKQLP